MHTNRFVTFALIVITLIFGFLSYRILKPFFVPLAWAVVLSIVFYPIYTVILRLVKWESIASLLTMLLILLILLGPFLSVIFMLTVELRDAAASIKTGEMDITDRIVGHPTVKWATENIKNLAGGENIDLRGVVSDGINNIGRRLLGSVSEGAGNILTGIVNFILMFFSIFFFLKDGHHFIRRLNTFLPFQEEQKLRLERQIKDIVVSTVFGGVIVALVQGVIGGFSFYFLGIKSSAMWGAAMSASSFVPLVGTFIVWGPASLYLFLNGAVNKAIILILIGIFVISMADNILRPLIIGGKTKMPIMMILFGVLGGIGLFGLIGIIAGPLVLAIFVSIIEIFVSVEGGSNA